MALDSTTILHQLCRRLCSEERFGPMDGWRPETERAGRPSCNRAESKPAFYPTALETRLSDRQ